MHQKIFFEIFFSGLKRSSQSPDRFYTYEAISTDAINGWKFAPKLKNLAKISKKFSKKNFFFKNSYNLLIHRENSKFSIFEMVIRLGPYYNRPYILLSQKWRFVDQGWRAKMEFFIGLKSKIDGRTFFGFFWFSMAPTIKNNFLDLQNCEIWPLVRLKQPK